jgi:hypothetical protein
MKGRSPIRRFLDERDEVAAYHPHALQKVFVSRDVLRDWRDLDAGAWRAEGWEDAGELAAPGQSEEEFRQALEKALAVTEVQVVESPPDYLEVAPV